MSALIHLSQTEGLPPPSPPAPTLSQNVPGRPHAPSTSWVCSLRCGPRALPSPTAITDRAPVLPSACAPAGGRHSSPVPSHQSSPGARTRSDPRTPFQAEEGEPALPVASPVPALQTSAEATPSVSSPLLCPALSPLSDLSSSALSLGVPPTPFQGRAFSTKGRLPASPAGRGAQILMRVSCPPPRGRSVHPAGPDQPQGAAGGTELFAGHMSKHAEEQGRFLGG